MKCLDEKARQDLALAAYHIAPVIPLRKSAPLSHKRKLGMSSLISLQRWVVAMKTNAAFATKPLLHAERGQM